ncbi:MAG: sulfatase-like hydrolase/transferase, partial [Gemmatimonadota bacterium]
HPHRTDADWLAPLGPGPATLAEYLAARGYATGGFVGNLIYATRETGLDRGFARYEDYPVSPAMVANSTWAARWIARTLTARLGRERPLVHKDAARINRDFLEWLDGRSDRPFFAFLNYMDAHAPYVPPDSLHARFGPRRTWRAQGDLAWKREWTEEELAAERAAYEASIAYVDARVGELLEGLEARGVLSSTLVIVASDHGEQFGEHGLVDHGNSLYRPLLHVPLALRLPGEAVSRRRVGRPVSLRDLPATIADLLGDPDPPFPGRSLRPLWEDAPSGAGASGGDYLVLSAVNQGVRMEEWMPAARGDMRSIVFGPPGAAGGYHYIRGPGGEEHLYALDDIDEARDLAGDPLHAEVLD